MNCVRSRLMYPSCPLHHRLLRPLLANQHRLHRGLQPNSLPRHRSAAVLLPHLHQQRRPPPHPQTAASPRTFQPRSIRSAHQHCLDGLSAVGLCDEFLPRHGASNPADYELVVPCLWWSAYHWRILLCSLGRDIIMLGLWNMSAGALDQVVALKAEIGDEAVYLM